MQKLVSFFQVQSCRVGRKWVGRKGLFSLCIFERSERVAMVA